MPQLHIIDIYTRTAVIIIVYSKLLVVRRHNTDMHTIYTAFCSTLCQDNIVKTLPVANMRWTGNYTRIYIHIYNLGGETRKFGVDGRVIFKSM